MYFRKSHGDAWLLIFLLKMFFWLMHSRTLSPTNKNAAGRYGSKSKWMSLESTESFPHIFSNYLASNAAVTYYSSQPSHITLMAWHRYFALRCQLSHHPQTTATVMLIHCDFDRAEEIPPVPCRH